MDLVCLCPGAFTLLLLQKETKVGLCPAHPHSPKKVRVKSGTEAKSSDLEIREPSFKSELLQGAGGPGLNPPTFLTGMCVLGGHNGLSTQNVVRIE